MTIVDTDERGRYTVIIMNLDTLLFFPVSMSENITGCLTFSEPDASRPLSMAYERN